ncbi:PIG-L family deacetylase [Phytoactinopolyspora limicola]|uniref:PIG-L family deacetylase n=1 Tax=Phytoactinopolyspora limicola TaxID=2715536 RepID=UPI001408BDF9|nr:PIG-L family deacetylase [Phytoactinopolyspora limicola]
MSSPINGHPAAGQGSSMHGRTVLVVHAHPDDEAIFTGVTIRRLADAGARVVLVTATLGDLGQARTPLRAGETLVQRRTSELEQAAELLGVARLVLLGRRDSGLPGSIDNLHPDALAAADAELIAVRLAELVEAEGAEAVIHDDDAGIYGHPDHVAVNRIGARAAGLAGVTSYQTTVDRDHLHDARPHLVHAAARATALPFGVARSEVGLALAATPSELAAKRAAIAAHASQIGPAELAHASFDDAYGYEWYLRTGGAGILDDLATGPAVTRPAVLATAP